MRNVAAAPPFVLLLLGLSALLAGYETLAHFQLTTSIVAFVGSKGPPSHHHQVSSLSALGDEESNVAGATAASASGVAAAAHRNFPMWGGEGIHMASLLSFIEGLVQKDASVGRFMESLVYVWGNRGNSTESSSIADQGAEGGVWASEMLRQRTMLSPKRDPMVARFRDVEPALTRAFRYLSSIRHGDEVAQRRWAALLRVTKSEGGFPLVMWNTDFRGCNRHNFMRNRSVPILTTCANVHCNYSFPFPNFQTVRDSFSDSKSWDSHFRRQSEECPWHKKRNQVVWRGSLTGPAPRIRLAKFAAQQQDNPLLDIGITRVPDAKAISDEVLQTLLMKPSMPGEDFSHYKAILDIDGNSWSSRFGNLLCRNSVILKVEPQYVEYFYKDLTPWKHYVPIRANLSDLLETIEWILDASNRDRVLQIIDTANEWCRTHMTHEGVTRDVLDILNAYVLLLDRDDTDWWTRWRSSIAQLFDAQSRLDMRRLQ